MTKHRVRKKPKGKHTSQDADEKREIFQFFWKSQSPFSQWHSSDFTGVSSYDPEGIERQFSDCEQWMMYNKALLFEDDDIANQILQNSGKPKKCKALGRRVQHFEQERWNQHKRRIVYDGNRLKFTQNPDLLQQLLNSNGTLVEASPYDRVWGIGLKATDPKAANRKTWKGQNLLGEILTQLRDDLLNEKVDE